ncbi:MAG: nitrilase-related carbon-nitrogen hydrolase [Chloroflexota bacterium]
MPYSAAPNYECVPLRSDEITVAAIQSRIRNIDMSTPESIRKGKMENIAHMADLVTRAQGWGRKDLVCFHESPIGGFETRWDKQQFLNAGVDFPEGEEMEAIGKIAQRWNCYIEFACYAKLKDWPGHFINMATIIGPSGKVIYGRWKTRNLSGFADLGTTVYDVLDEFVKRYGWDAIFPVARTDIGNIAIIPEVCEPEMARIYAMKGCEILIRYMTLGAGHWSTSPLLGPRGGGDNTFIIDMQGMCIASGIWGIFVNNALDREGDIIWDVGSGNSCIIDTDGRIISQANSLFETVADATIPMTLYRKRHWTPRFPKELYTQAYDNYVPRFPTNSYLQSQPQNIKELSAHYKSIARW